MIDTSDTLRGVSFFFVAVTLILYGANEADRQIKAY